MTTAMAEDFEAANQLLGGLRTDIRRWTSDAVELIDKTLAEVEGGAGERSNRVKALRRAKRRVLQELSKLDAMELRVVIAAPMSAGKSTIIDAIVSAEVLPRRNTAMTVFPTEICLDPDVLTPSLELGEQFRGLLTQAEKALRSFSMDASLREALAGDNPELVRLFDDVHAGSRVVSSKLERDEDIYSALQRVNDLARLTTSLVPEASPVRDFNPSMTPRVTVPVPSAVATAGEATDGRMVIVDTPGPNEDRAGHLYDVLDRELEVGTMVLLILDYTQLNTGAASEIKHRVDGVLEFVRRENVCVIVNKIDQRKRPEDLSKEGVEDMVRAKLGLSDVNLEGRLFEVAAERALAAAKAFRKLEGAWAAGQIDLDDPVISELLRLRFPVDWSEELACLREESAESIRDEIEKSAKRLWRKSGFERFLGTVITQVLRRTGHKILKSASSAAIGALELVSDSVELQAAALREDAQKLESELEALRSEKEYLLRVEEEVEHLADNKLDKFTRQIDKLRQPWRKEVRELVQAHFDAVRGNQSAIPQGGQSGGFTGLRAVLKRLSGKTIRKGEVTFRSKQVAERAGNEITRYANGLVEGTAKRLGRRFQNEMAQLYEDIESVCADKVDPIFKKAQERLNETFDVDLTTPEFSLANLDVGTVDSNLNTDKQSYTVREKKKRRAKKFYNLGGRLPFGPMETYYTKVSKKRTIYKLSLTSLESQAVDNVDRALDSLETALAAHLEQDVSEGISSYISGVNAVFAQFEESLEAAMADQKKSVAERKELQERLDHMASSANGLRPKLRRHMTLIEQQEVA